MSERMSDGIDMGIGQLSVSEDTVAMIAYVEANSTPGIIEVSSDVSDEFYEMLGSDHHKGITVDVGQKECIVRILICVEYGVDIRKVAKELQARIAFRVKEQLEITAKEVNINIVDIKNIDDISDMDEDEKEEAYYLDPEAPEVAGTVAVSEYVVAYIASNEAKKVEGVAGLSGGIAGEIAGIFSKRNNARGVKVQVGQRQAAIELFIIVNYGGRIPDIAWALQESVKDRVELFTGLNVVAVDITIQGIDFDNASQDEFN